MIQKPQREKVHLSRVGKSGTDIYINPISIADDEWINERWTPEEHQRAFTEVNVDVLFGIFWRVMDDDGKRAIAALKFVDWDGLEEKPVDILDPVERLKRVVSGGKEILELMTAIFETRRKSNPDVKRNEKKSPPGGQSSLTRNSTTSSPTSTAGTPKKSEDTRGENSQI